MATFSGNLYHPANHHPAPVYHGFSWPCLFFGFLWFAAKGLWGWAIVNFLTVFPTYGVSLLVWPFIANQLNRTSLLRRGFLTAEQLRERGGVPAP